MSFAFVPRKVGKKPPASAAGTFGDSKGKGPAVNVLPYTTSAATVSTSRTNENSALVEELASLVVLSLTEYALWANGDFRRRMEQATEDEHGQFLSLRYILKHSPFIQEQQVYSQKSNTRLPSESTIVKSLRKHAENDIETRMVLAGPTWYNWGSSSSDTDEGMYEVRSKKRPSQGLEDAEPYTRDYWAKRTVYVENIPLTYRTMHGVFQFVRNIYPSTERPKIQNISFPPHYLDTHTDVSSLHQVSKSKYKCKGFAFVVFSSPDEVDQFSKTWNWERSWSGSAIIETDASPSLLISTSNVPLHADLIVEARKQGFRALSKAKWDALKGEYMAWRQELLEQVLAEQENREEDEVDHQVDYQWEEEDYNESGNGGKAHSSRGNVPSTSLTSSPASLSMSSSYPPNCLVYIRNLHTGTNKTTLRTLFRKALIDAGAEKGNEGTESQNPSQDIDYVDYTKGMDTCYLRFSSPFQANAIQLYFANHRIVQRTALDDRVETHLEAERSQQVGHIKVEVVQGRREEIYWEKVPMKVKQEAVRKALSVADPFSLPTVASASSFVSSGFSTSSVLPSSKMESLLHVSSVSSECQPTPPSLPYQPPLYPPNCLLFVRNVHPGTNKTILRALFVNVLSQKGKSRNTGNGLDSNTHSIIDYVDYTKGTDSCHLRVASSPNARFLVEYFEDNLVVQHTPLDISASGIVAGDGNKGGTAQRRGIVVELVQGIREKIYWEKIPMKVRQEAVRIATSELSQPLIASSDVPSASPTFSTAVRLGPSSTTSELNLKAKSSLKPSKKRKLVCTGIGVEISEQGGDNSRSRLSDEKLWRKEK
ncbi:hypothetical protein J3R30DRAFT_316025 [Lentinula aciculospora]|uniref:XRRM domain-containing protein n=1 Tax=Lentinula aciculospora TaxID=153920 RepID=A0A9W9A7Z8_9AGAR|nr:hypothetical protein J3R30DRAFT_316025 [Lentinula aciculospora]